MSRHGPPPRPGVHRRLPALRQVRLTVRSRPAYTLPTAPHSQSRNGYATSSTLDRRTPPKPPSSTYSSVPGVLHALRQQGFTCWDPSSTEDPLQPGPEDSRPVYKPFEIPPSRTRQIEVLPGSPPNRPLFNYFLDGSMRTTSAGHVVDTTGRFLPIFISQIGVAATKLRGGSLQLEQYRCRNVLFLPDTFASDDISASRPAIHRATQDHRHPLDLELECYAVDEEVPPIEGARKHVLGVMHQMEIDCIADLAKSGKITRDALLMIDGSLQFYEDLSVHKEAFRNVVGVAKSFDLHQVVGKARRSEDHGGLSRRRAAAAAPERLLAGYRTGISLSGRGT